MELVQKRLGLKEQGKSAGEEPDSEGVEKAFIKAFMEAAKEYSERKGISYSAWREIGVPAATLREAGVSRTRAEWPDHSTPRCSWRTESRRD